MKKQSKRFWNWAGESDSRELRLYGTIALESWYDDDVTPKMFRDELMRGEGPITVWLNSCGGDCVAASQIYAMLIDYPYDVTVKIDGIAASAASVVAMAGTHVLMSPTACLMIHDPMTAAVGSAADMEKAIAMLTSVKDGIIDAYQIKTGLDRKTLARMMSEETWMDCRKAIELGFADGVLEKASPIVNNVEPVLFSQRAVDRALVNRMKVAPSGGVPIEPLYARLNRLKAELSRPVGTPLITTPGAGVRTGRAADAYKGAMLTALRTNFRQVSNVLMEGADSAGGYLVPDEWDARLIEKLEQENILRRLGTVIQTNGECKLNVATGKPAASWIEENGELVFGNAAFSQVILDAWKLSVAVKVSEELLSDNAYDLEGFITRAFGQVIANAEEEAFIIGNGNKKPLGILAETGGGEIGVTSAGTAITADEVVDLIYKLKRPYRTKAAFLTSDSTLAAIRKLKDGTGQFLWQPALTAGEPDRLLGYPVYTSAYVPTIAAGQPIMAFGDFSYYNIADRGTRSFAALHELYAGVGQVAFVAKERVDGKLVLPEAVQILRMKGTAAQG